MKLKKKNIREKVKDEKLNESPQYRFFRDEILKDYQLDTLYNTGEITVYRNNKRTVKAVRRMVKFLYDIENDQPTIYEYYVDALTNESNLKSYNNINIITDKIEAEAKSVKSLEDAYNRYIPMDNFMMRTVNQFKDKVEEIVTKEISIGYRVINLNWKTITVTPLKMSAGDKLLEDHIIIHTSFSDKFFWDNIPIDISDIENAESIIDISGELDEESINREFNKYFK